MTYFAGVEMSAPIHAPTQDKTTPDACAHVDVKHWVGPSARAKQGLGQRSGVGVVLQVGWQTGRLSEDGSQGTARPSLHMMRAPDHASGSIHRPSKAYPHSHWRGRSFHLVQ
jgi:hypothetical protein